MRSALYRNSARVRLRLDIFLIGLGCVALAAGLGASIAARRGLLQGAAAGVPVPLLAVLLGLALTLLTVGLWLYVFPPLGAGAAGRGPPVGSHRRIVSSVALIISGGNLLAGLLSTITGASADLMSVSGFIIAALTLAVTLAAFLAVWVKRQPGVRWSDLGLRLGNGLVGDLGLGLLGGILVFVASAAVQLLLREMGVIQTQLEQFRWMADLAAASYIGLALLGVVVGPAAEEAFFRGFVFQSYLRAKGPVTAYVGSAALFAVLHLNLEAVLPIFVMGLVLAFLFHRSGSLLPGFVAHAFNNGLAFVALYGLRSG